MHILVSKFIYPHHQKDLEICLSPFKDLNIQLAFFQKKDFLNLNHKRIKSLSCSLNIKISTIHAPTVDIFDEEFFQFLRLIKEVYNVKVISIHPQKGDSNLALEKFKDLSEVIKDLDLILAYENFPENTGKRKWIFEPFDMYEKFNLSFLKLTFDTAHLDEPKNCLKEIEKVFDKVEVIHLSDSDYKRRHLPLGLGVVPYLEFLGYLKKNKFRSFVVLEYLEEFEDRLIADLKKVEDFLC